LLGASQLTVSGNLTINSGKILNVAANGTVKTGGNWSNQGVFNSGTGTVEFTGNAPSTLSGKTLATITLAQYTRSTFASGMTVLTGATTSGASGDDGSADVSLPFNFYYAGTAYSTVHMCTNGWISLNGSGSNAWGNAYLFNSTAPNVTIAPWFDDLRDDATSSVNYLTEGSSPNRVFTVEWYRVRTYSSSSNPYARISFQVKLYETSNIIEFHYGIAETGNHHVSESASIGIEDAISGPYHFVEATTGSMTTAVTNLQSLSNWPTINYRFTPTLTENFYNLTINKTGTSVSVVNDVIIQGNLMVNPGSNLDVPSSKSINILGTAK
jgi:hypothetical protein